MTDQHDFNRDIAEIRSMMERSSKFLSLSGWAGFLAGIFALIGAWIAHDIFGFHPNDFFYPFQNITQLIFLASGILILALLSAILDSRRKAQLRGENTWNATSRHLLTSMAVPLVTGGFVILLLLSNGLLGLIAPLTLLFYGLALYNAAQFTFREVKVMGIVQIILGIMNIWFIESGLLFWALGFGVVHIIYGVYMYFRYER